MTAKRGKVYTIILQPESDPEFEGYYSASVPALPGCFSYGTTREEALGSIKEDWGRLRLAVDLAIAGRVDEVDLKRALKTQARIVETWERLIAVVVRYINAKYAAEPS